MSWHQLTEVESSCLSGLIKPGEKAVLEQDSDAVFANGRFRGHSPNDLWQFLIYGPELLV